jgi:hypothetical protein
MALFFTRKQRTKRPVDRRRSFVPRLECLEDRTVPSSLTVTNNLDSGPGSLRDAIGHARDGDTISFDPGLNGQTIVLTSDELAVSKSLDIEGPGAGLLGVSGNNASRVFDVSQNQKPVTVTIAGLTIEDGLSPGLGSGGAIYNVGSTLNLVNDVLCNNVARGSPGNGSDGGAVNNYNKGTLTVSNCTFSGNQAIGGAGGNFAGGGGIENEPGGILHVSQSTFNNNRAQGGDGGTIDHKHPFIGLGFGGGIDNFFGTATIDRCTFTGNQAVGGSGASGGGGASQYDEAAALGGGVWNYGTSSLTISRSTFAYNRAVGGSNSTVGTGGMGHVGDAGGGGLETEGGGTVTITDSAFDHNQAIGGSNIRGNGNNFIAGWGHGGAISNSSWTPTAGTAPGANPSTVIASNLTVTNNQAIGGAGDTGPLGGLGDGGGIENWYGGTFNISNSTIASNQAIGGAGAAGQTGADGLGGALANVMGAAFTVSNCTMTSNQAVGGAGGSRGNGGNGFGGGFYNQGDSLFGTSSLTVTSSTVTGNSATGGAPGSSGSAGLGVGGGVYFATGGSVCLDQYTVSNIDGNTASTSNNDIFGVFTIC